MNIDYWLGRADRALATAAFVAADGDPNDACSNAYYAMFYAARVALLHVGQAERAIEQDPLRHDVRLQQYLVKPGFLPVEFGRAFSFELNRRILADYEEGGVTPDGAAEAIASAKAFVAAMKALIAD